MRVFVTGANGFVGSAVVKELVSAGHSVLGLARSEAAAKSVAEAGAEVVRGSLEDVEALARAAAASDATIHTAFIHDFSSFGNSLAVDRRAIEALGEALAGTGRPFLTTSGTGTVADEDDAGDPTPPAGARRAADALTLSFAARGVRAMVVRLPPTVHGAGDHGFVPMLISRAREKGVSAYVGDGRHRWAAVSRLDAATVYRLALEKGVAGARYHAVGEEGVPTREIAERIGRGLRVPVVSKSPEEAAGHFGFLGHFFAMDCPASSEKTRARLGWQARHPGLLTDMEEAGYFGG